MLECCSKVINSWRPVLRGICHGEARDGSDNLGFGTVDVETKGFAVFLHSLKKWQDVGWMQNTVAVVKVR